MENVSIQKRPELTFHFQNSYIVCFVKCLALYSVVLRIGKGGKGGKGVNEWSQKAKSVKVKKN